MAELNGTSLISDANLEGYWRLEGNSTDSSSKGRNGTDTAITYSSGNGKYGQGAGFNGTTSKIAVGTATALWTTPFTYVGWVNPPDTSTRVIFAGNNTTNSPSYFINASGKPALAKEGIAVLGTANTALSTGVWNHVAVTYDATTIKFYLNGSADGTPANTATFSGTPTMEMGSDDGTFYNGALDDFAVFSRILTASEIATLATATTPTAPSGTLALMGVGM